MCVVFKGRPMECTIAKGPLVLERTSNRVCLVQKMLTSRMQKAPIRQCLEALEAARCIAYLTHPWILFDGIEHLKRVNASRPCALKIHVVGGGRGGGGEGMTTRGDEFCLLAQIACYKGSGTCLHFAGDSK